MKTLSKRGITYIPRKTSSHRNLSQTQIYPTDIPQELPCKLPPLKVLDIIVNPMNVWSFVLIFSFALVLVKPVVHPLVKVVYLQLLLFAVTLVWPCANVDFNNAKILLSPNFYALGTPYCFLLCLYRLAITNACALTPLISYPDHFILLFSPSFVIFICYLQYLFISYGPP